MENTDIQLQEKIAELENKMISLENAYTIIMCALDKNIRNVNKIFKVKHENTILNVLEFLILKLGELAKFSVYWLLLIVIIKILFF